MSAAIAASLIVAVVLLAGQRALGAVCGDGIVDPPDETCDPPGSDPAPPGGPPLVCRSDCTYCGDGKVRPYPLEECDQGSENGGDFPACCMANCKIRPYSCTLDGNTCTAPIGISTTDPQPGPPMQDLVKIRNKMRINTPYIENDAKILFTSRGLYNPAPPPIDVGARNYMLDAHFNRLHWVGPWMDNADYFAYGLIGMKTFSTTLFPTITPGAIDCGDAPTLSAFSRDASKITGKDVTVLFEKGPTFTSPPLTGWTSVVVEPRNPPDPICPNEGVAANLPPGTYQQWNATVSVDGVEHHLEYAVPFDNPNGSEKTGRFIDPRELFVILTEFFQFGTFVQAYVWDMEVQSANSSTWLPVTEFNQGHTFVGTHNSTGVRVGIYNNRPVLEFSNDGTNTYHSFGDTFTLPPDVASVPSPLPRVQFTTATQVVYNDQRELTVTAKLDRTSTSAVTAALKMIGTSAGMGYISDFGSPILTILPGNLTGSVSFTLNGPFPSGTDDATIFMHRSCGAMIGEVPADTLSFFQPALVSSVNDTLTITGTEANDCIAVSLTGDPTYPLIVTNVCVAGLQAGQGCEQSGSKAARCSAATLGTAELRGGDDTFLDGSTSCPDSPDSLSTSLVWTRVSGDAGRDNICSGRESIVAIGGPGDDVIKARGGFTYLAVYWQNHLVGEDGVDTIVGGRYRDAIDGGLGQDKLRANAGSDIIGAKDGTQDDEVHCGNGTDHAQVDSDDPVRQCETIVP